MFLFSFLNILLCHRSPLRNRHQISQSFVRSSDHRAFPWYSYEPPAPGEGNAGTETGTPVLQTKTRSRDQRRYRTNRVVWQFNGSTSSEHPRGKSLALLNDRATGRSCASRPFLSHRLGSLWQSWCVAWCRIAGNHDAHRKAGDASHNLSFRFILELANRATG